MLMLLCRHCGNRSPHHVKLHESGKRLYEVIDDKEYYAEYEYFVLECGTCHNLSMAGGFRHEHSSGEPRPDEYPIIYPTGPDLVPPIHTLSGSQPIVPEKVLSAYAAAWPLRMNAPNAFANQIRRALEFICQDEGAEGNTLYQQLEGLADRGEFSAEIAGIAHLVREVGNVGSHADQNEVGYWDAELLDRLFRSIVHYVYVLPAHSKRMRGRMSV